ncbi:MAG: DEAD/DEAH box helicase [Candidatus Riflebacteria bacterium]|nr:DEAD/DEAH box helicase [Candidatus Riflebacteria bacterium]
MTVRRWAPVRVHPALLHHIVNTLGWPSVRPLQQAAIDPILDGIHTLLIAPTAGGKTEAALFPVLSRMMTDEWPALSVVYVCPLKALLNNLHQRLQHYAQPVGRQADWLGRPRHRTGIAPGHPAAQEGEQGDGRTRGPGASARTRNGPSRRHQHWKTQSPPGSSPRGPCSGMGNAGFEPATPTV